MSLTEYQRKRDFSRTPEPRGGRSAGGGLAFVIQKHAARRLHYDFRLELDGALKSWAVPKGPSLDPQVRSLAVQVEDHPLDYGAFEGIIPEGEYGGGTVLLWDRGEWTPTGDPAKSFAKGKLKFRLQGEKLAGEWTLVRMSGDAGDGGKNWLLIKSDDKLARAAEEYDVLEQAPRSVASGRMLEAVAAEWSSNGRQTQRRTARPVSPPEVAQVEGARPRRFPNNFKPQLATLARQAPLGEDWLHELKFDGYRLLCAIDGKQVRLRTRRGNDWTERFPTVAAAVGRLAIDGVLLDGEVVVMAADGTSDFQALQNLLRRGRDDDVVYYAFDLPYYQGHDLSRVPLVDRKQLLAQLLESQGANGVLRYSDHIVGAGNQVAARACRAALEGIVCKRADSRYEQRRSKSWVKVKCLSRQEFVVGGWTDPSGSRSGFGALLLGYYDGDRLIYCGRVGTGFTEQTLADLKQELDRHETDRSCFVDPPTGAEARGVHWTEPELVVEVEFGNWTNDGLLRHPSFQGLREDKLPRDVGREMPIADDASRDQAPSRRPAAQPRRNASTGANEFAGVRLSNPDRVLYPQQGLTKADLAGYYESIANWILPHIVDRPLSLVRCPKGRGEQCFYQKHLTETFSEPVRGIDVEEKNKTATYLAVRDLPGLITLVQLGVLEIHPWGSRGDKIDRPDRLIFDLDPDAGVSNEAIVSAARELAERLTELGLESFIRNSGGKGLHIVVPLVRRSTWHEVKQFAKAMATSMERDDRERYIATASKAKRAGKIFIDYLRNSRGATAIASYSTRARPGAPVAVPIRWDELSPSWRPDEYNAVNLPRRLAALKQDPWSDFFQVRQSLTKAALRKMGVS